MIWYMAETLAVLAENFMVTRLLINYFGFKVEKYQFLKGTLLFGLLSAIGILGTFVVKQEIFFVIAFLLGGILFSSLFLKGKIFEKCLISIISYVLFYFINLPVLNLISMVADIEVSELVSAQDGSRIACLFTTKILYFAATQFILCLKKKDKYSFKFNEWIIIVSAFFITLMIGLMIHNITTENSKLSNWAFMCIALLLSALDVIVFVFMRKMHFSNLKETERQLLNMQLAQQQNEMQQLDQQYKRISTLQHDFKNKIECVHNLIMQKDYDKAISYSEKLLGESNNIAFNYIQCSCSVVNAVVNSKFSRANDYGIKTSCRIVVPLPEYLEYDLSILLSNLLDNAIEACQRNKSDSQIILTISDVAGYYRITVKNTIEKSELKTNKKLKTRKKDKKQHGWGLKSVHDIAEKYEGNVDIYENDGMFIVNTLLMKEKQLSTFGG